MMFAAGSGAKIDDSVKDAVAKDNVRAVKVDIDAKAQRLVAGQAWESAETLAEDFANVAQALEDAVPCLVLFRLADAARTVPWAAESSWAMIAWTPDGAPVKLRMLAASSREAVKKSLSKLVFAEYHASERTDVDLKQYLEMARPKTEADRLDCMSRKELELHEVKQKVMTEVKAAPARMSGMVSMACHVQDSFREAMAQLTVGTAVIAELTGEKNENLDAQVVSDVSSPADLRGGKLPDDKPCYVVMRLTEDRVLFLSWSPEAAPARLKMKFSTFKLSVREAVKEAVGSLTVASADASEEDDLAEDMGREAEPVQPTESETTVESEAPPQGVKRAPPGSIALPGMGAMPAFGK